MGIWWWDDVWRGREVLGGKLEDDDGRPVVKVVGEG